MRRPMSAAFLIQLLMSAVAVAAMVGFTAWIGVPSVAGDLSEAQVSSLMAEQHPDMAIDMVALAPDGRSAIATSGARALVVSRVGDGHVVEAAA